MIIRRLCSCIKTYLFIVYAYKTEIIKNVAGFKLYLMNLGVVPSQPGGKYSLLSSSVMAAHTVLSHCLMMECDSLGPLASARSMALLICLVGPFDSRRLGFDKSLGLIWA